MNLARQEMISLENDKRSRLRIYLFIYLFLEFFYYIYTCFLAYLPSKNSVKTLQFGHFSAIRVNVLRSLGENCVAKVEKKKKKKCPRLR